MVVATRPAARRAERSAQGPAPRPALRLVRFSIQPAAEDAGVNRGDEPPTAFALPLDRVAEVVALGKAASPPPRGWLGTLVRDGLPVPVGDLAFLLGLPAQPARRGGRRALLLRDEAGGPARFGIASDTVPTVVEAQPEEVQPLPPGVVGPAGALVGATWARDDQFLFLLDLPAILDALGKGVTRDRRSGRVTALRALPRPATGTARLAPAADADRSRAVTEWPARALVLAPLETADGAATFAPALPLGWVREVLPRRPLQIVPRAPAGVAGLLVWRGRALPVFDLAFLLTGIPGGAGGRLVVVGRPGEETARGALLVPGVRGLRQIDAPAAAGTPPETLPTAPLAAWIDAAGGEGAEALALLAPAALFA